MLKFFGWILLILTVSTITALVIYKIAIWLALAITLLAAGFIIGTPTVLFVRYKYYKALKASKI